MDSKEAARFLQREYMWHIDMLEALNRDRGQVVYFKGDTVLVRRAEAPDFYLLTSEDPSAAEEAFRGLPTPRCVVARGPGVAERMAERFSLRLGGYCCNVAYLKQERFSWDCPDLIIRAFREE